MSDSLVQILVKKFKGYVVFFGALALFAGEATVLPFDPLGWALLVLFLVNIVIASVLVDVIVGGAILGIGTALSSDG